MYLGDVLNWLEGGCGLVRAGLGLVWDSLILVRVRSGDVLKLLWGYSEVSLLFIFG